MARHKTHRQVDASENPSPKEATEEGEAKIGHKITGRRPSRKGKTKEKGKRRKSNESAKRCQSDSVHM